MTSTDTETYRNLAGVVKQNDVAVVIGYPA